jgi:hypothetical protein
MLIIKLALWIIAFLTIGFYISSQKARIDALDCIDKSTPVSISISRYPHVAKFVQRAKSNSALPVLEKNTYNIDKRRNTGWSMGGVKKESGMYRFQYPPAIGREDKSAYIGQVPFQEKQAEAYIAKKLDQYCDNQQFELVR